jgi:hypothetical protein
MYELVYGVLLLSIFGTVAWMVWDNYRRLKTHD